MPRFHQPLTPLLSLFAVAAFLAPIDARAAAKGGGGCEAECLYSYCSIHCSSGNPSCTCEGDTAKCSCTSASAGAIASADVVGANKLQAANLYSLIQHFEGSGSREGAVLAEHSRAMLYALNGGDVEAYDAAREALRATMAGASQATLIDFIEFNGTLPFPAMCESTDVDVNVGVNGAVEHQVGCTAVGAEGAAPLGVLFGLVALARRRRDRS